MVPKKTKYLLLQAKTIVAKQIFTMKRFSLDILYFKRANLRWRNTVESVFKHCVLVDRILCLAFVQMSNGCFAIRKTSLN